MALDGSLAKLGATRTRSFGVEAKITHLAGTASVPAETISCIATVVSFISWRDWNFQLIPGVGFVFARRGHHGDAQVGKAPLLQSS